MSLRFMEIALAALIGLNLLGAAVAGMLGSEEAFADFAFGSVAACASLWLVILFEEWENSRG